MNRSSNNNAKYVNFERYERHLSLFGRKVLHNLAKKWVDDLRHTQNICPSYQTHMSQSHVFGTPQRDQNKKVLTFLSVNPINTIALQPPAMPHPPITRSEIVSENSNTDEEPFDFSAYMKHLLPVPTSKELFQTVDSPTRTNDSKKENDNSIQNSHSKVNITTYDMIAQVLDADKSRDISPDSFTEPNKIDIQNDENESSLAGPNINWNDMFDTELLSDDAITNVKLIQDNAIDPHSTGKGCNIAVPNLNMNKKCNDKVMKPNKISDVKQNVKKRKRQTKNPNDSLPIKIKKASELDKPEMSFRKQKYTKTVKNWLDDVNPNNSVDEEIATVTKNTVEFSKNALDIAIDKNRETPKKVVQAQLANKDGKMKFRKPKRDQEPDTVSGKVETDKTKEKKSKTKFMAPIKSQLPVKDVTYDVVIIDEINISEHAESLCMMKNRDLVNILVYSNGFSQLNYHHTGDECEPEGFIINAEEIFYYFKGVHQSFRKTIEFLLEHNKIICYEGKSLLMYLKSKFDLDFCNLNMFDAKIGGCLIDPETPPETFSDVQKLVSYTPQYTIASECALQKAAWYATLLKELSSTLTRLLQENDVLRVFEDIEMKLVPIIAEMELRGVTVDLQKLKAMEDILVARMKDVELECYRAAGKTFQLNSAAQIRNIIYDELELDKKCNVTIKETVVKGAKSTSEAMLRSLVAVHALPKWILEYRHLHKAHATFLAGVAHHVRGGRVRPTWVQTAAATGRIACSNPNLQAIPKAPFSLTVFPDDATGESPSLNFRSVYTADGRGVLLAADFQQVECRVLAHCAGDAALLAALQAGDLFRGLAAQWLSKSESEVSCEERERTKRIVYASLYGAGRGALAALLAAPRDRAGAVIDSFNRAFPSLKSFGRSVWTRCAARGGRLRSAGGRARRLPHIASAEPARRAHAQRQAVNFIIQGTAADICKTAMVLTDKRLRARRPPLAARLLLQIHDELVWEMPHDHVDAAAAIIKEVMEGCGAACGLPSTLPVAISTGINWGEMEPYRAPQ